MIKEIATWMIFGFALYGFLTAMFEVKDWLGRRYDNNPPYLVRIMHIIVIVALILFMTRAMEGD